MSATLPPLSIISHLICITMELDDVIASPIVLIASPREFVKERLLVMGSNQILVSPLGRDVDEYL
jgi:hypothetical protein